MTTVPGAPRAGARLAAMLSRHPIVCLLLLTPGIPEYLSGSTSWAPLVTNPLVFFLFLGLNLALYGPGVLLVREAMIRWRKGWATMIALGTAYAIVEEGLAVDTFFNPRAAPVGTLGSYGHAFGVSWVWVASVVMVHVVYSLGLPIVLHRAALPGTAGKSLLSERGIALALGILAADVIVLEVFVMHADQFWYGVPLLLGSLGSIAALVAAGRMFPARLLELPERPPRLGRSALFAIGVLLLPGTLVLSSVHGSAAFYPAVTIAVLLAFDAALLAIARSALGRASNVRGVVAFAAGALVPIMLLGIVTNARIPLVLLPDVATVAFLFHLWRRYPDTPTGAVPGASGTSPLEALRA